jgi:RNA polymerase sigma-70 factor (ECF subfamily)
MNMEQSDQSLLNMYLDGQVDALEQLVEKHKGPLFGYIFNMVRSQHEADEVFQEVWFKVIKKAASYKNKNFRGWLMRIAHNIVIDRYRKKKPSVSLDDDRDDSRPLLDSVSANVESPAAETANSEVAAMIEEGVRNLPQNQKEVFVMRMKAGLTFREIAKIQKVTINTALARMQYALAKLRPGLIEVYHEL